MKTAIVAAAWNGLGSYVIGDNNKMPWHLPSELRWFRMKTMGKPIVMGRTTWETLPKPLDGRRMIVFSTQEIPGVETINRPELAPDDAIICGGAKTYAAFLPFLDTIIFTEIFSFIEGDTVFPLAKDQLHRIFRVTKEYKLCVENNISWKRFIYERR